jgi:hypothetical protein
VPAVWLTNPEPQALTAAICELAGRGRGQGQGKPVDAALKP